MACHYTTPTPSQGPVDLIVAADVVWLDELVSPLAKYLRAVLDRPGSRHAGGYPPVGGLGSTIDNRSVGGA